MKQNIIYTFKSLKAEKLDFVVCTCWVCAKVYADLFEKKLVSPWCRGRCLFLLAKFCCICGKAGPTVRFTRVIYVSPQKIPEVTYQHISSDALSCLVKVRSAARKRLAHSSQRGEIFL